MKLWNLKYIFYKHAEKQLKNNNYLTFSFIDYHLLGIMPIIYLLHSSTDTVLIFLLPCLPSTPGVEISLLPRKLTDPALDHLLFVPLHC